MPKKGDLTSCGNWRGITLLSILAKVLGRVLIKRIVAGTDAEIRRQAAFRKGRSTTEQIFVLRNTVEQVLKWNSSLYLCLEYERAFDSINRDWTIKELLWINHCCRDAICQGSRLSWWLTER